MIPVYGFVEGDTLGLLILADKNESIADLIEKMERSVMWRVPKKENPVLLHQGKELRRDLLVGHSPLEPLDRIDLRFKPSRKPDGV